MACCMEEKKIDESFNEILENLEIDKRVQILSEEICKYPQSYFYLFLLEFAFLLN